MERNEAQEKVISTINGQLLVIACPGSGKTTTLVRRIAHMIETGIPADSIIMMTFSRAAAKEMEERFNRLYPDLPAGTVFSTIHSLCFLLVKQHTSYTDESIVDEYEVYAMMKRLMQGDRKIMDNFSDFYKKLMLDIGNVKNRMLTPDDIDPECTSDRTLFKNLYNRYEEYKAENGKIDFDDMLLMALDLMQKNPALVGELQKRYRYIQVDEYQDTNVVQARIIYLLAGKSGNLAVVGDDDQSIYGFRAASPEIMMDFPNEYPDARIITMGTNYRSKDEIISSANRVIKHNRKRFDKEFRGVNGKGGTVTLKYTPSSAAESRYVISGIKDMTSGGNALKYSDIAILFRKNIQAEPIAQALADSGIPFRSTEKVRSRYEGFIYNDILSFRKVATAQPGEDISQELYSLLCKPMRFYRHGVENNGMDYVYMKRFISATTGESWKVKKGLEDLDDFFSGMRIVTNGSPAQALKAIRGRIGYDRYLVKYAQYRNENEKDYLDILDRFEKDIAENDIKTWGQWEAFAQKTIKVFDALNTPGGNAVTISTMHRSKGLEWDTVFMTGCDEDNIPGRNGEGDAVEEERRLFYVAMTRAKRVLKISYTGYKNESRFVHEITGRDQPEDKSLKNRLDML